VEFLEAISTKERCRDLFSKISKIILQHEGGYVNNPNDRGGETNMGITIATWQAYARLDLGIEPSSDTLKSMTNAQAEIIYYNHYWEPKGFCKLENTKIALMIYDWTITSGRAVKQIRRMLHNEYNSRLIINNTMDDDMIHCINNVNDQSTLLQRIADIRREYYRSLTVTNGQPNNQVIFLTDWLNRVDDCLRVSI
jgi:lysozyme family protein